MRGLMLYGAALVSPILSLKPGLMAELTPRVGKPWGVYQIHWNTQQFNAGLQRQIVDLGAEPDYVLFFADLKMRHGFPAVACAVVFREGATPVISLELLRWGRGHAMGDVLHEITQGRFDNYFTEMATQVAAAVPEGRQAILRFGFEMNGDWFPWGEQPEAFVAAWRHAYALVDAIAGEKIKWMWSPNIIWAERTPEKDLHPYYPGDDVVDFVGLDGYNFGDHHDQWHQWQSYAEVFGRSIEALSHYDKPLFIAEVGCADGPRKAAWLEDFFHNVSLDDRIHAFIYFNFDKSGEGEPDWTLASDPESLRVTRSWLQNTEKEKLGFSDP